MGYIPVRGQRALLFRFDPERAIIQIKQAGVVYEVDLRRAADPTGPPAVRAVFGESQRRDSDNASADERQNAKSVDQ